jgi:hypothetical protein
MTFAARTHWDAPLAADVVAATYSNSAPSGSTTSIQFQSNGDVVVSDEFGNSVRYQWKIGGGEGADYEVRWTNTSGTLSTGTAGTWLSLSSNRQFLVLFNGTGVKSCTGTVEIRMAAAPNTVFDSASITITAVGENPA